MSTESPEEKLRRMKNSVSGSKSWLTRDIKAAERLADVAENNPSTRVKTEIQTQLDGLKTRYMTVIDALEQIRKSFVPTTELTTYIDTSCADTTTEYERGRDRLLTAEAQLEELFLSRAEGTREVTVHEPSDPRPKIANNLTPFTLSDENSPVELSAWIKEVESFFYASNLERADTRVQQSYLLKFLAINIRQRIEGDFAPHMDVLDKNDGCLALVIRDFEIRYPAFNRRLDFFAVKQKGGQSALSFAKHLEAVGNEASLAHVTVEDLYIHRLIEGLVDKELRDKLLKLQVRNRETFLQEITAYDAANASSIRLDGACANAISGKQFKNKPKHKGKKKGGKSNGKKKNIAPITTLEALKGKCMRCARSNHKTKDCSFAKQPGKVTCHNCGNEGHLKKACLGTMSRFNTPASSRAPSPVNDSDSTSIVHCNKVGRATPRVSVSIKAKNGSGTPFLCEFIPDSGATRTILPYSLVKTYGLKLDPSNEVIRAANNTKMACEGQIKLAIRCHGKTIEVQALVSSAVKDMLVAWFDLVDLGILPSNFPARINKVDEQREEMQTVDQAKLTAILQTFDDVLNDNLKSTPITGPPMKIHLSEQAKPKRIIATRRIPAHYEEEAKRIIAQLLEDGVIAELDAPTDWLSPAFFVQKESGGLRLVVDFSASGLNDYVQRNIHPFPSAKEIVNSIRPDSLWFAKLDATQGYHQVMLDKESQKLTAFILPFGCYYYKRSAMGLASSGDEFNKRTDIAVRKVADALKIVDDVLIQAPTQEVLLQRLETFFEACRAQNITISYKKLQVGQEIKFAGYIIGKNGIKPDPAKIQAIEDFPTPKDLSTLRSFLGLANQLGSFIPDLTHMTVSLRQLLKKDTAFIWLEDHQQSFEETKRLLTSDMVVKPFDPKLETQLLTDASRLKGLGFALMQKDIDGNQRLIQCGSRSLTPAERNYATIELECLGIQYGIMQCRHFLLGMDGFLVLTDHRPLKGIFQKRLDDIANTRLQRIRLGLVDYKFKVDYTPGKTHLIADALSRAPVFAPAENDEEMVNTTLCYSIASDPILEPLYKSALEDNDYQRTIQALLDGKSPKNLPLDHPTKLYQNVWDDISIMDGLLILGSQKIIIPQNGRDGILKALHIPHCGINKTKEQARQLYYWPGMSQDIENMVRGCMECQMNLPSLQKEPLVPTVPVGPMSHIGLDLAHEGGHTYIIMVDAYSGFVFCSQLQKTDTSAVTRQLENWFLDVGFPAFARSDGGPQFRSEFNTFCKQNNIHHDHSSAYYPRSNGLAENGVKTCKQLLKKHHSHFQSFRKALLEWRNTPRPDGYSPAQMFIGRRQRTHLPCLSVAYEPIDQSLAAQSRAEERQRIKIRHDENAKELPPLQTGQEVLLQHPVTKQWDSQGRIVSTRVDGRSYEVQTKNGIFLRNRRFLRPSSKTVQESDDQPKIPSVKGSILRRSPRLAEKKRSVSFAQSSMQDGKRTKQSS